MSVMIGSYGLSLAVLVAAGTILASLVAARLRNNACLNVARWGMALFTILLGVCSATLLLALWQNDFSFAYVASYSEIALPVGYKLTAFWAGQEGSLLLWALMLAVMSLILVITRRRDRGTEPAVTLLVLAVVCGFFAALMLFAADPFRLNPQPGMDGHGLNPMLQNIGMIIHPPTLFLGYAGCTIPFALMIGAMIAGKVDNTWINHSRRWILVSWLFLSIGIILGAQWAYVELGWGGYWAWDPVENASLLPWLTATALLHSVMVQQHRNMFKVWNVVLAAITFLLCIFGTYLTRSGVIQSVHGFEKSLVGTFFLVFLLLSILVSAIIILIRLRQLRYQPPLKGFASREGVLLIGNTMLLVMMGLTLLGTIFPLISQALAGQSITVNQGFYNKTVLPFALLLMVMMAVAPLLRYGQVNLREVARSSRISAALAILVVIVFVCLGIHGFWAISCAAVITLTLAGIVADIIRTLFAKHTNASRNPILATLSVLDSNHRRYGGYLAHIGIAMIVAGIAGSSLFGTKTSLELTADHSATLGSRTITLQSIRSLSQDNYQAMEAVVLATDSQGHQTLLRPQIRRYNKAEQNNAEVAIQCSWREDLYVTLAGYDDRDGVAALQVIVNPLVIWIWVGGLVLSLGGLFCVLPSLGKQGVSEAIAVQAIS